MLRRHSRGVQTHARAAMQEVLAADCPIACAVAGACTDGGATLLATEHMHADGNLCHDLKHSQGYCGCAIKSPQGSLQSMVAHLQRAEG